MPRTTVGNTASVPATSCPDFGDGPVRMSEETPCSCQIEESASPVEKPLFDGPMVRTVFRIPGMDCPAEEQLIRLRLAGLPIARLEFDLPARTVVVCHGGSAPEILDRLVPLGFGAELVSSAPLDVDDQLPPGATDESKTLWILLAINSVMFAVEIVAGWLADSAGLLADGADMFADALVYGTALYAVGRDPRHQRLAARLAGGLQLLLALWALSEVARRAWAGSFPEEIAMVGISLLALIANVACLALIARHRKGGIHMRASYIFSANDVLANFGVIVAGILVAWTGSPVPDWVIGGLIGVVVLAGALRIFRLR